MRLTKSGTIIAILAIVVAAEVIAAGLYILWLDPPPEVESAELFSAPTIVLNNTGSSYDLFRDRTIYTDAGSTADHFEAGTNYWFDIRSTPTEKAREMLSSNDSSFYGWIWCIEAQSADGSSPELNLWYYTYYIIYGGFVDAKWNTTSSGKAVGLGGIAPNRDLAHSMPLWMQAEAFTVAETHGWLNFTKSGDYTIRAYLLNASDDWLVPSTAPVALDRIPDPSSQIGQISIQVKNEVAGGQYFTTPSLVINQSSPHYESGIYAPSGYLDANAPAGKVTTDTPYSLVMSANPTDDAYQYLTERLSDVNTSTYGWIWVIEVHKPGIKASDVEVHPVVSFLWPLFKPSGWNTSKPDSLVTTAWMAPDRDIRRVWLYKDPGYYTSWWNQTKVQAYIVFNTTGVYTIDTYLVSFDDLQSSIELGAYQGVPYLNSFNISSPIGRIEVSVGEVHNSNLFTAPTMTFNQTVAQYSSHYGRNLYEDANLEATSTIKGTPYWFEFRSTVIGDEAGKRLEPNGANPTGWVWVIVIEKTDITPSDIWVEFRMDNKFPDMRTTITWNDSQPGKLVGPVNLAPDRFYAGTPAIEWADNFHGEVVAHGVIQFNETGPYLISAYLAPLNAVDSYSPIGGAPTFLDDQIASPISSATRWVL